MKTKFFNEQEGSVLVLMAVSLVLLLGLSAIVIDLGSVFYEKQKLQSAIDSTCLAAVQDMPDEGAATATAEKYIKDNGYKLENIIISFPDSNSVKITSAAEDKSEKKPVMVEYAFAKIKQIGINNKVVNVSATAVKSDPGEAFNYAVFAGGDDITFHGGGHVIKGNVYGKDGVSMNGNGNSISGNVETTSPNTIDVSGTTGPQHKLSYSIPMPTLEELIKQQGVIYNNSDEFNAAIAKGKTVNGPIYVKGDLTINGRIPGTGIICASGKISMDKKSVIAQQESDSICFYAEGGDITFNGGAGSIIGILYAPNGTVTINGAKGEVYGRIIADSVTDNGNGFSVTSSQKDLNGLHTLKAVKLVK